MQEFNKIIDRFERNDKSNFNSIINKKTDYDTIKMIDSKLPSFLQKKSNYDSYKLQPYTNKSLEVKSPQLYSITMNNNVLQGLNNKSNLLGIKSNYIRQQGDLFEFLNLGKVPIDEMVEIAKANFTLIHQMMK